MVVYHVVDDAARTETYGRGGPSASVRTLTPGGRLESLRLSGGATVTVTARDARGRPTRVDHDAVPVTLSWAADDQPVQVHVGGGLDLTACYTYGDDRRLRVIRWVQGVRAGDRCPEPPNDPPGDLCAGAVAVYATDGFDAEGKAREVRQCVAGSARTDTLAYDDRGRLTAWRTAASGPLGQPVAETAHFRRYDALDQLLGEDVARWPAARADFPDADGALRPGTSLDRLNRREVVRTRSDGAIDRIADHETGDEIALSPDAAGRATTDSQEFRELALDRDRQGRPARDTYDGDGRRIASAAGGETLTWDAHGLVRYAQGARARVFAPPLPGVQLSRRSDGQWEVALVTPTQTPLAVVAVSAGGGGSARLQALYSPTGEPSEARTTADGYGYPKTWAGHLKYPDLGLFGETAGLLDAGARLYAPTWGQFLEGDPVLPDPAAPDTWGRYAYGGGDTVGMWDPEGRCAVPGAVIGGLLGGVVALATGEDWRGVLAGALAGSATGATCGLSLLGQVGIGAAVGAAHGTASAAIHGGDLAVGALRGGLGGAIGGVLGFQLGRAAGALGQDLVGVSGFAGRAGLNYAGDVAGDLGVQGALYGVGLQDRVSLRDALVSGLTGTAGRAAHFSRGAYRGWRGRRGRFDNLGSVLGLGLPVPTTGIATRPQSALERNRMKGWLNYQDDGHEGFKTFEEWDAAGREGAERLQPLVDRAVAELVADPGLAERQRYLSENEVNAIRTLDTVLKPLGAPNWLNRVFFGKAVERHVRTAVGLDSELDALLAYRGGASQPDFAGVGRFAGVNFDVTTRKQVDRHLSRRGYGAGLNIATYQFPMSFSGF